MTVVDHLDPWKRRQALLDPTVTDTMCALNRENQAEAADASLGLVPVRELIDLRVTDHPGWSQDEQAKIDAYVNQLDLFDTADKSALEDLDSKVVIAESVSSPRAAVTSRASSTGSSWLSSAGSAAQAMPSFAAHFEPSSST
ncbi:hypothetical protein H9L10_13170 [Phycicoccus endophyticus]|uniref:Uncharacterized protein n=1 Tax=Phycicoccus endophyticus TaxID=1690220 RepID=A0A7G9R0P1_9MICO|nr:hypothetical protein [Phycicoccus endophyticus]NHI19448.1 hypothetical protein [Phycicoccus endophyticus]QNN49166.1 hypothetical protein H9L10_13170 [Phycicoccus endophyticus]